jgi:hypothetical protein
MGGSSYLVKMAQTLHEAYEDMMKEMELEVKPTQGVQVLNFDAMMELTRLIPIMIQLHTRKVHDRLERELCGIQMTVHSGPLLAHAFIVDCPTCMFLLKKAGCSQVGAIQALDHAQVSMTADQRQYILSSV